MGNPVHLLLEWLHLVRSARARSFLLLTLFVDVTLVFVFLVAIQTYLPEQHEGSEGLPGYVLAVYGASKLIGQLLAGRVVDRIQGAKALYAGLVLTLIGHSALIPAALSPEIALPAAGVYGLGGALIWPALYARAGAAFATQERAKIASGMMVTTGLALVLGLGAGALLPADFPYTASIGIGFVPIGLALVAARASGETGVRRQGEREPVATLAEAARAVLQPQRLCFSVLMLLQTTAMGALLAVFRAYGRDTLEVSLREEILLLAPAAAIGGAGVILGGVMAVRLGRMPVMGAGFLLAAVSIWGLATFTEAESVVPLAAAGALGLGLALPSVWALAMDLSRTPGGGTVLGWFLTMEGLGIAAGPALGGGISETAGVTTVLWMAGGLLLAVSAMAFMPRLWGKVPASLAAPVRGGDQGF